MSPSSEKELLHDALQDFRQRLHFQVPLNLKQCSEFREESRIITVANAEKRNVWRHFLRKVSELDHPDEDKVRDCAKEFKRGVRKLIDQCVTKHKKYKTQAESQAEKDIERHCGKLKTYLEEKLVENPEIDLRSFLGTGKSFAQNSFQQQWNHGNFKFFKEYKIKLEEKLEELEEEMYDKQRTILEGKMEENVDDRSSSSPLNQTIPKSGSKYGGVDGVQNVKTTLKTRRSSSKPVDVVVGMAAGKRKAKITKLQSKSEKTNEVPLQSESSGLRRGRSRRVHEEPAGSNSDCKPSKQSKAKTPTSGKGNEGSELQSKSKPGNVNASLLSSLGLPLLLPTVNLVRISHGTGTRNGNGSTSSSSLKPQKDVDNGLELHSNPNNQVIDGARSEDEANGPGGHRKKETGLPLRTATLPLSNLRNALSITSGGEKRNMKMKMQLQLMKTNEMHLQSEIGTGRRTRSQNVTPSNSNDGSGNQSDKSIGQNESLSPPNADHDQVQVINGTRYEEEVTGGVQGRQRPIRKTRQKSAASASSTEKHNAPSVTSGGGKRKMPFRFREKTKQLLLEKKKKLQSESESGGRRDGCGLDLIAHQVLGVSSKVKRDMTKNQLKSSPERKPVEERKKSASPQAQAKRGIPGRKPIEGNKRGKRQEERESTEQIKGKRTRRGTRSGSGAQVDLPFMSES